MVGSSSSSRLGRCQTISASASRAFSPPEKLPTGCVDHVAAEIEAAEEVAQLLLARRRARAREVPQRRLVGAQLLDLVLREVADRQPLRGVRSPRERRQVAGERLDQRRLARAVGAEQADALAGEDAPVELDRAPAARRR